MSTYDTNVIQLGNTNNKMATPAPVQLQLPLTVSGLVFLCICLVHTRRWFLSRCARSHDHNDDMENQMSEHQTMVNFGPKSELINFLTFSVSRSKIVCQFVRYRPLNISSTLFSFSLRKSFDNKVWLNPQKD